MRIEIEKPKRVVIDNGVISIEGARRVHAEGSELSLADCNNGGQSLEINEPSDNPDEDILSHVAQEDLGGIQITTASHDYTPKDMQLGKPFPILETMSLIGTIPPNKKDLIFPHGERDIITIKEKLGEQGSCILDFRHLFAEDFVFGRGGKFGCGFGLGKATTGCKDIEPDGASVRFMWRGIKENGEYNLDKFAPRANAMLYIYHQDRKERCGDNFYFGEVIAGVNHRFTLSIQTELSGLAIVDLWFDEKHVLKLNLKLLDAYRFVDWILYWQAFRGGSADDMTWYLPPEGYAFISAVDAYSIESSI